MFLRSVMFSMLLASLLTEISNYFRDNPAYFWIAVAVVLIIVVVIIAIIVSAVRRSKKKKAARSAGGTQLSATPKTAQSQSKPAEKAATESSADPFAPSKPKTVTPVAKNEDVFTPKIADEPTKQPQAAAAKQEEPAAVFAAAQDEAAPEKKAEDAKTSEPAPQPAATAPATAAKPAVKADKPATKKAAAQPIVKAEEPAAKPAAPKSVKAAEPSAEEEAEHRHPYSGKWMIFKREDGNFYFELRASNGEKLLGSIDYSSMQGAKAGIRTYKNNIAKDNFTIAQSKTGQFFFKLLSGSRQMLCTGETYSTRPRCESAVESVKRFAETAVVTVAAENDDDRD